jgi:hypothetical protein
MAPSYRIALPSLALLLLLRCCAAAEPDWRALDAGALILQDLYLDQPYVAVVPQPRSPARSRWVATITRNSRPEGNRGEHVECLFSDDAGASWSAPVALEPGAGTAEGLTNAYSSILATDFGRLYVSYNLNIDNVTHFPSGQPFTRDDTQGAYVARWSDDAGQTWSSERVVLPVRPTRIDRDNTPFNGSLQLFWSVDQYKRRPGGDATVFLGFTKIGTYLYEPPEEAWFFASPNMATERDVSAIAWRTLPAGDAGVASAPAGTIIEETHVLPLSAQGGGGCFAVFRTDQGHLGAAATRDPLAASAWGPAHAASFWAATPSAAAAGAVLRNPRGPITLKRLSGGRYLLLFYNNADTGFTSRNPYWLAAGVEDAALGEVVFSQPEVALFYAQDNSTRPGYPDLIEDAAAAALPSPACPTPSRLGCTVFISETNKTHARLHGLPPDFLDLLLRQDTLAAAATRGLALSLGSAARGRAFPAPPLPAFDPSPLAPQAGWSLELWLGGSLGAAGQALVDVRGANGTGFVVRMVAGAGGGALTLQLALADAGGVAAAFTLDAPCARLLASASAGPAGRAHVVLVVDASAHIALGVVEGLLCSGGGGGGGEVRGWQWLPMALRGFAGARESFVWGGDYAGALLGGRWYSRALTVSEAIGNGRAGPPTAD